jgi:two-component system, NtrC family, sensor kinase
MVQGEPVQARARETVLVVEESLTLRELLRFWLECFGYRVVTLPRETEPHDVLGDEDVALVLSGNDAPGMKGLDVLDTLRGTAYEQLPVVRLSEAMGDTAAAVVARHIRVDALLSKERLDVALLLDTIDALLRTQRVTAAH